MDAYLGDHAARLDLGHGHHALVESVLPLRGRDSAGDRAPMDLALVDRGSFLAPLASLARLRLPNRVADGIELPDVGIGVVPESAASAAQAQQAEGSVFWANAAGADTDLFATALPWGFELFGQLRSVDSPEDIRLHLSLPPGARAETADPTGPVTIKRGDAVLAEFRPPHVSDADGISVPTSYSLDGDLLTVHVAHRGADVRYPLLLDPVVIENQQYWWSNTNLDGNGWTSYSSAPGCYSNVFGYGTFGWGLYTRNAGSVFCANGQQAGWRFLSPGTTSFVYEAEFDLLNSRMQNDCTAVGIWQFSGSNEVAWTKCVDMVNANPLLCADNWVCAPNVGTPDNYAAMITWMSGDGARDSFESYMGGAKVYLNDLTAPVATVKSSGAPAGWVDKTSANAVITGYDTGLGVKQFKLISPGSPDATRTWTCVGDRNDRCPIYRHVYSNDPNTTGASFSYNTDPMPEGVVSVAGQVQDLTGNWSTPVSWQVKVDHQPPALRFSGSLWDHQGQTLEPGNYVLQVDATDGTSDGNPADARSGVQTISTFVDGTLMPGQNTYGGSVSGPNSQTCDAGSCSMSQTIDFPTVAFLPGTHTITIDATDQLGHQSERQFTVTTAAPGAGAGQSGYYYGTTCDYAQGQAVPLGLNSDGNQAAVYAGSGSSGTADAAVGACAYSPATGSMGVAGGTVETGVGAGKGGSLTNQGPVATPAPPVGVYAVADGDNQNWFGGGFFPQTKSYFGVSNYETCPSGSISCSSDSNSGGYQFDFGTPVPLLMCGYWGAWYTESYDGCSVRGMFD